MAVADPGQAQALRGQAVRLSTPRSRQRDRWWRTAAPYVFISPFYIVFLAFGLLPIIFSLGVSMFDWQAISPGGFVGLNNYLVLLQDPSFYQALRNTVFVWVGSVPAMTILALVFAVMLNSRRTRFRGVFRTVYFLPIVTSLVVAGLLFGMMFSTTSGLANRLLEVVGLPAINWLGDPAWMKISLILALLWRWIGHDMVIMLAGLQQIPGEVYEAARVDGASEFQIFWRITVPLMRPAIVFVAIVSTIGTFNLFEEPYVLFGKRVVDQAAVVTGTYLYQNSFVYFKLGYGAAIAWVIALIVIVLSMIQLKLGGRDAS